MSKQKRRAVVLDFDGTVLRKPNQSVFHLIHQYADLPPRTAERMDRIRSQFLDRGERGLITPQEERDWLFTEVAAWIEGGLTPKQVAQAMLHARLRPYVGECLNWLRQRRIPVTIISYGIRQFVEMVLHANGLGNLVDRVYALDLRLDYRTGRYCGQVADSAVTPSNKGAWSRHFAKKHHVRTDQLYAVGDSPGDRDLGHLKKNRIGLAVDHEEAERLTRYFSEVLVTDNFRPAWNWLRRCLR